MLFKSLQSLKPSFKFKFSLRTGVYLVVHHTGRFIRVLTLYDGIMIRGCTSREALFRLVSSGAIRGLIRIECRGCILLIQNGDGGKQLLDKAKDFYSHLVYANKND